MQNYSSLGGTTAQPADRPETALEALTGKLTIICNEAANNTNRIAAFLGRAAGEREEKAEAGKPRPVPNGIFDRIAEKIEDINHVLAAQRSLLERLETIA